MFFDIFTLVAHLVETSGLENRLGTSYPTLHKHLIHPQCSAVDIHGHAGKVHGVPVCLIGLHPAPDGVAPHDNGSAIDACRHSCELVVVQSSILRLNVFSPGQENCVNH